MVGVGVDFVLRMRVVLWGVNFFERVLVWKCGVGSYVG